MACDKIFWNILFDFLTLAAVSLSLLMVVLFAEPYHRGFFEDDESIRLPYKDESISAGLLAGLGFAIIVVTILITEVMRNRRGSGIGEKFLSGSLIPGWVWESYRGIGVFTFGAACVMLAVNITKFSLGRLRPHFYDVCRPLVNQSSPLNELGYIVDYTCQGTDLDLIEEARVSFPSGHSGFSMYSAVFFIFYVQVKCRWRGSKLLRHGAQFAALVGAWYVGLSRVVEHKHHCSDVAVGFLVGAVFAAFTFVYILKPKKYGLPPSWQDSEVPNNPNNALPRPVLAR